MSQVPDPGGIVVIQTACYCVLDSSYVHIPIVAGEHRVKADGESMHIQVFDLGIHGCLVVVQGRVGEEA